MVLEVVGWLGAAGLLLAYALVSTGRLDPTGWPFQVLNLVSGAALAVNSGVNGAWPSAALNVVWVGIGLYALARLAVPKPAVPTPALPEPAVAGGQRRTSRSRRASATR